MNIFTRFKNLFGATRKVQDTKEKIREQIIDKFVDTDIDGLADLVAEYKRLNGGETDIENQLTLTCTFEDDEDASLIAHAVLPLVTDTAEKYLLNYSFSCAVKRNLKKTCSVFLAHCDPALTIRTNEMCPLRCAVEFSHVDILREMFKTWKIDEKMHQSLFKELREIAIKNVDLAKRSIAYTNNVYMHESTVSDLQETLKRTEECLAILLEHKAGTI